MGVDLSAESSRDLNDSFFGPDCALCLAPDENCFRQKFVARVLGCLHDGMGLLALILNIFIRPRRRIVTSSRGSNSDLSQKIV